MEWLSQFMISLQSFDAIFSIILISIFLKKYRDTKIQAIGALSLFFIIDFIVGIIELMALLFGDQTLEALYLSDTELFPIIFSALGILGAGTFLIFIDFYDSEKVPTIDIVIIISTFSSFVTYNIVKILNLNAGNQFKIPGIPPTPFSFEFLPALLISYLIIRTYPILLRLRKRTENAKKIKAIDGLLISLFFLFIITAISVTLSHMLTLNTDNLLITSTLLPRLAVLIGIIILVFTYGNNSPAYLHNQEIEKLLVITKEGMPIYSLEFTEFSYQKDDVLISGSLAALSGLLAETISVSDLELIEFKEKEVMIEHSAKVGFFLITDRPSAFLWNALRSTVGTLNKTIDESKEEMMTAMIRDKSIDRKVLEIFGFQDGKITT